MEIYIVDKDDSELCTKQIEDVDWANEIYRSASIWLYNTDGEVLIAQRAHDKIQSPGCWGPSAAGIVESHETYEENILNETKEELGVSLLATDLIPGSKEFIKGTNPDRTYFTQYFFSTNSQPADSFTVQEDEVVAVKWISVSKLIQSSQEHPDQYVDIIPKVLEQIPKE